MDEDVWHGSPSECPARFYHSAPAGKAATRQSPWDSGRMRRRSGQPYKMLRSGIEWHFYAKPAEAPWSTVQPKSLPNTSRPSAQATPVQPRKAKRLAATSADAVEASDGILVDESSGSPSAGRPEDAELAAELDRACVVRRPARDADDLGLGRLRLRDEG